MRGAWFVAVVTTAFVIPAQPSAQAPPDLSGTWTLTSKDTYPTEQRLTISQTPMTVTIDGSSFYVSGVFDGTRSSMTQTAYASRTIYTLDGLERPRDVTTNRPPSAPQPTARVMTMSLEEAIVKAGWAGRQLVVMTYEKLKTTRPYATPADVVTRRTIREVIALDADGALVWETLIVADPMPWSTDVPTPTPFRRLFKRAAP